MKVTSYRDDLYKLYIPDSANRDPGLHLSEITQALLRDRYPRWFKRYDEEETLRQVRMFEKGHIVEEAWGDALAQMVRCFHKPRAKQVDEIWMSPDGYAESAQDWTDWPKEYPNLVLPAIFECKAGLKSCHPVTSPITHEKFYGWIWNVMGYCYGWGACNAYLMSHHFNGDYTKRPHEATLMVHHFQWTTEELQEYWGMILEQAKEMGNE